MENYWILRMYFLYQFFISDIGPFYFQMIDDNDLGFFANFLGISIFILVIAYHFVMAEPKYEGNWNIAAASIIISIACYSDIISM